VGLSTRITSSAIRLHSSHFSFGTCGYVSTRGRTRAVPCEYYRVPVSTTEYSRAYPRSPVSVCGSGWAGGRKSLQRSAAQCAGTRPRRRSRG
jgi:hypothetical protein